MVRRLIEHNDVRRRKQESAEGYARLLTSGESSHTFRKIFFLKSETFQNTGHFRAIGIAVSPVEFLLIMGIGFHLRFQRVTGETCHTLFGSAHAAVQQKDILFYHHELFKYRSVTGEILVLGQIAYIFSPREGDNARIRRHLLHDDFKQRGLAGPVNTNQCGFLVLLNMKRDFPKHLIARECLTHFLYVKYHSLLL